MSKGIIEENHDVLLSIMLPAPSLLVHSGILIPNTQFLRSFMGKFYSYMVHANFFSHIFGLHKGGDE